MEALIIPKDQYEKLLARIEQIHLNVVKLAPNHTFVDNNEFVEIMKISKRTASAWRDEKRIAFSQVGSKVYYKVSDIEKLLQSNYNQIPKGLR